MKTMIQAAGHGTDTDTAQNAAIESTFLEIAAMRRWDWLTKNSTTLTLTTGNPTVTLADADANDVIAVRMSFGSDFYEPLVQNSRDELERLLHTDQVNGVPIYYALYRGSPTGSLSIKVYPRPDKAYILSFDYENSPTVATDDAWEPPFPLEYHAILVWGALRILSFRQRDWNAYNAASAEYRLQLRDLLHLHDSNKPESVPHWAGWDGVKT